MFGELPGETFAYPAKRSALGAFSARRSAYRKVTDYRMLAHRQPRHCPHCSKPLTPARYGVAVSAKAIRILDALEAAGANGVSVTDLCRACYGNHTSLDTLRSYISALNRVLAPAGVAIRSDRCVYRLMIRRCA
jgi:hypothetical protein